MSEPPVNFKHKATELERIVDSWERRYEWRQLSRSLPRSLMAALALGLLLGLVGYFRFRLSAQELAVIGLGLCAIGGLLNLLYTLVFPRPLPVRAKYFDLEFGLQERVSTAFELMSGRIQTHPEIEARQIEEALASARAIDANAEIDLDFRKGELAALLILALALVGMLMLPALLGEDFQAQSTAAAVEEAQEELRESIETVAKDTGLDDVDRQDLLEALEVALERLEEEEISEEEAFAAMSHLKSRLEDMEHRLEDTIELDQSALEAGLEALENFIPPSATQSENPDAGADMPNAERLEALSQGLEELAQEAAGMSSEERRDAADALNQAAEDMAGMDSQTAERMQDMAEALQNGDDPRMQEALSAAQDSLDQEQARQRQNQEAQQLLQQQSERAEAAADSIARQQSQEGQPQRQSESGESGQRASQQGSQQEADARMAANQGSQEAQRNRPGNEGQQRSQNSRTSGAGAGDSEPSNQSLPGSAGEDQGADPNNNPSGERQIEYEALYSPSGISGGGQNEMRLRTDANDTAIAEGDFDDNPIGESRVSYDTVFSEYQTAANRALESDYVPLGLRDVVREYFTSLEPGSAS